MTVSAPLSLVFAIPGDRYRRSGGFIYESTVLDELRGLGHRVAHLQLPAGFPDPTGAEIAETLDLLCAVPADTPILLDGFIPGCIGPEAMARIAAPVVPIIHHPLGMETGLDPERAAGLLQSEAAALRHAARIVVPSPNTAGHLIGGFGLDPARIDIAPPGFAPARNTPDPLDPPLILSVGLLAPRKGHDVLLDALARLGDLRWQARIVGDTHDPAYADRLHRQVRRLGLTGRVTLTGLLSEAEVAASYDQAAIFALATRFEGYGMVFGEAMRCGLPIVTCNTGAVPETVGPAARLVPVDDPAGFADALRTLLDDPAAFAALAAQSAERGRALPLWRDTAALIADTLAQTVSTTRQRPA